MTAHHSCEPPHDSHSETGSGDGIPVTISADGFVLVTDDSLQALLAAADFGLSVINGRIHASGSAARRLERAVTQLRREMKPLTIAFPERRECGALILEIRPAYTAPEAGETASTAKLTGTFRHAATDNLPSDDRIAQMLGLSPAEASLSLALARGVSPYNYSRQQGVTKNTVRSQLAVIRKKTGARSQTQIANLIWLLANEA